jgi:hypothetical protein
MQIEHTGVGYAGEIIVCQADGSPEVVGYTEDLPQLVTAVEIRNFGQRRWGGG